MTTQSEPIGEILPGPARVHGEVSSSDPSYTAILTEMKQHGDLTTIGGTDCNCTDPAHDHSTFKSSSGVGQSATASQGLSSSTIDPTDYSTTSGPSAGATSGPLTGTPACDSPQTPSGTATTATAAAQPEHKHVGFGAQEDYKNFQSQTDTTHTHAIPQADRKGSKSSTSGRKASGIGGFFAALTGRRKSSTPGHAEKKLSVSEPSNPDRRVSTSGYSASYHPSSFTRTEDTGYTTNPSGGTNWEETNTGGAHLTGGRGYMVDGSTGAEGLTKGPLGDFTEAGPGGGEATQGHSLKSRIAALVDRGEERKDGNILKNEGL